MDLDTTTTLDNRRHNLRLLADQSVILARLSRKLKVNRQFFRNLADSKTAVIDARLAREIEACLGLVSGWLEQPRSFLTEEARSFAKKWAILPGSIKQQITAIMDHQLKHARTGPHSRNPGRTRLKSIDKHPDS